MQAPFLLHEKSFTVKKNTLTKKQEKTGVRMKSGEKEIDQLLEKVKRLVLETKYGNIILIIQDGKVIQIDKTEKIRL